MYTEQYNQLNRQRVDWQTEEEVRLGWLTILQNTLAITFHAERGRSDADYNQVIIEFKNVGLFHGNQKSAKFQEALEELSRYIPAKAGIEGLDVRHYQGIAIDGESIAFVHISSENGQPIPGPIMPLSPDSVQMVFEACRQSCRRAVTATNLIEDFGHGSVAGGNLMQALATALMLYLDDPNNNKVKMLYQEWKALYGQVADLSSFQVEAIINSIGFTCTSTSTDKLSRILFVIHTFDSIIIKLLSAEIVSHLTELTSYSDFAQNAVSVSDYELISMLDLDIERSQLYTRANIHGFVEEPLFSWYIDACTSNVYPEVVNDIVTSLKEVLIKLSLYQMEDLSHAQTNDVLKRFYQNIVPQVLRKSLGEFYTPDWLVDVTLDKVEGQFDELKFLDPTCGSASFLLAIIKRIRECSNLSAVDLLQRITQNVWGFDLNPLAVQTARVNYLIALSDLIAEAPGIHIEIPILLADAIYAPAPDEGDTSVVNYVIGSNVADLTITLPTVLSQSRDRLDTVFSIMGECVENDMEPVRMIDGLLVHNAITVEERESWEPILSSTYARVLDLHRRNWNGIWFRIVRNYFWSSTAGEFDVIVGNPPWVRWSKLPELYRNRVSPTCRKYDIFSRTPYYGGNELDISGLITYTVSDKWLRSGGQLIFLLTQTHFQSASSEGFRRFRIDENNFLFPESVEDLKALKPFPDAANKTVIFVAKKGGVQPSFPVDYAVWSSAQGKSRTIPEHATKQEVLNRTTRTFLEANPVQGGSSPWAILPSGDFDICKKLVGKCTWTEGRKGITCDLNGVYFVNVVNVSYDGTRVQIETRPEAGRTNIGPKRRFWVEHNLLYPVIKGASDLKACQYNPQHELYAIVPNRGITSTWLSQAETEVEQNNRLLYDYFRAFEQQLRSRSTYRTRMPSAPYYAVYNVGGYTFAPWKVVWPEQPGNSGLPVAVVNTRTLQGVGEKIVVPDHKIYFAEFDDETTALYLCGLLTCSLVQKFIASFHIMIQVGDIFKHMRLPEFDERNHQHMHLVELVREAHNENDADVRNNLLTQISDIGNSIIETWTPTE